MSMFFHKSTKFFDMTKNEINFCRLLFCGFFILWELFFYGSTGSMRKNRKIFMLHGI